MTQIQSNRDCHDFFLQFKHRCISVPPISPFAIAIATPLPVACVFLFLQTPMMGIV